MLWLLLLALCSLRASGNGDLARTHLYEEQLLMQELQVDQQHTQQKLQAIQQQRQFAPPGSPESLRLDAIQTQLLFKLQQATSQFQDLQAKLQLRFLNQRNPHAPSAPYLFRPPPSGLFLPSATAENEIRRRQSQQPQTPNKFPPPPPPPKPTPPPTTTTTTPPPPPTFETPERGICNYRGRQTCTQQCNRRNQQSCQQQCNNQQRNQRNNARSCVQQCLNSQSNCQQECIGPIQVVCLQQCNVRGEQASCLEQCSNTQNCARQCNASRTEPECLQECSTQNQQDCFQECGIQRNRMNCLQSCEEQENEENCPAITTTRPPPPRQQSSPTPATRPFNPTPSRPTTTPPPVTIAFNPSRRPVTTTVAPSLGTVPFNPPRTPPPRPIVVSPTTIQFNPPPPTIRPIQFTTTPAPIIFTTPPRPIQQFIQPQQQQQQFVQQPLQNPIQQQPQFIQQPQFVQTTTTTQQQLQPQLQQIQPQIQQIQPQIQQQIQPQIQQQIQPQQFVQQTTSQFLQPNQFQQLNQLPVPQAQVQQLQPQIQQIQQQQQQVQQQIQPNLTGSQCRTSSGGLGTCLPVTQCVTFFTELADLRRQPCSLGSAGQGVCCPPRQPDPIPDRGGPTLNGVIRAPSPPRVIIPNISPAQLDNAGLKALQVIQQRLELAAQLFAAGIFVPQRSPANFHQEFFQTTNDTLQRGQQAQSGVEASISLVQDFQLTPEQGAFALPTFSILNTVIADTCPPQIICDSRLKYRTADGSCNNLQDGRWGRAGVAHQRILPPKYGDGVNSPRSGSNNQVLPSSRSVSRALTGEGGDLVEDNLTLLVMQWGQFLDHDLTHTPISKGPSQSGIACCTNGRVSDSNRRHPDCFPITLPPQDPVFTPLGEQCMEFVRSLPAPRPQCNFGPREQMNQITGYLDGSNVYGSSAATQRELRLFQEGFLKAQQTRRSTLLLPENRGECTDDTDRLSCFKAGDGRVNEQIQLTVMHTVWMREHNRIAPILGNLNPTWTDEQVFQETRRIVIAQMQHITYNEWLPILLGTDTMERLSLLPLESGTRKLYDSNLNAGVTNVFATAAFRFGHSLVRDNIEGFSQFGSLRENLVLSKNQFSPFILYKDGAIDDLIRGMLTQQCQRFDRFFSKEVTDRLFQGDLPFGLDLVALNIQRGRDHGIPPYNDWREVCGRPRASSWQQLANDIDPQTLQVLQQVYSSVEEIDLFAALVSERPQTGALLGPTLVCLLSDQFARLRRGDRFFYEEEGEIAAFSPRQLAELKKSTLARVLCDNSDDVIRMQPRAFFKSSFTNQRVDCTSDAIPRMDLSPWAGEPVP